jgi:phage terminase small subunit
MELLNTITLKVELNPGSLIKDAIRDLCVLANRLGTRVEAKFNEVHLIVAPDDDATKLLAAYNQAEASGRAYKVASVND